MVYIVWKWCSEWANGLSVLSMTTLDLKWWSCGVYGLYPCTWCIEPASGSYVCQWFVYSLNDTNARNGAHLHDKSSRYDNRACPVRHGFFHCSFPCVSPSHLATSASPAFPLEVFPPRCALPLRDDPHERCRTCASLPKRDRLPRAVFFA
jgi:hypothetical protein